LTEFNKFFEKNEITILENKIYLNLSLTGDPYMNEKKVLFIKFDGVFEGY
jgi:hypothetical protein